LLVFLALLFFATHLLLHLYATSVVTSAAAEAARVAAVGDVDHDSPPAVAQARARGEERARALLGHHGESAKIDWSGSDADTVVVRVEAESPRFLGPGLLTSFDHIERTARARVETLR
jgi:hypothetical protein